MTTTEHPKSTENISDNSINDTINDTDNANNANAEISVEEWIINSFYFLGTQISKEVVFH